MNPDEKLAFVARRQMCEHASVHTCRKPQALRKWLWIERGIGQCFCSVERNYKAKRNFGGYKLDRVALAIIHKLYNERGSCLGRGLQPS